MARSGRVEFHAGACGVEPVTSRLQGMMTPGYELSRAAPPYLVRIFCVSARCSCWKQAETQTSKIAVTTLS